MDHTRTPRPSVVWRRALGIVCAGGITATAAVAAALSAPTAAGAVTPPGCVLTGRVQVTCTYGFTGDEQVFYTPLDVASVDVTLIGAAGAASQAIWQVPGGLGATVHRRVTLSSSLTRLFVEVGGAPTDANCQPNVNCRGGFNGGGSSYYGAGGGGASDVRSLPASQPSTLDSRLAVAAGGGGSGSPGSVEFGPPGAGGNAGMPGGAPGVGPATGGGAGTASAGGAGGYLGGSAGTAGVGGQGGRFGRDGGGGGGGLWGGGGGGNGGQAREPWRENPNAGGGGGSSYGDSMGIAPAGTPAGVTISYALPVAGPLRQAATAIGTGYCATPPGSGSWIGVPIALSVCKSGLSQQQFIVKGGNDLGVYLYNLRLGGCLDTADGNWVNGSWVVLGPCTGSLTQTWRLALSPQNTWQFQQFFSLLVLDTEDGKIAPGSRLVIGRSTGTATQQWTSVAQ